MRSSNDTNRWAYLVLGCVLGLAIGTFGVPSSLATWQDVPAKPAASNPQWRTLDANLWVQTSAEYQACCRTIFRAAAERMKAILRAGIPVGKRPAVMTDLDETIFDNAAFQSFLHRESLTYDDKWWAIFEEKFPHEVRLVPGAKEFIAEAQSWGVTMVYISNRQIKLREHTVEALKHCGLPVDDIENRLLLAPEKDDQGKDTSAKSARRKLAHERYQILLVLGDNLRDFDEKYRRPRDFPSDVGGQQAAIAARNKLVEEDAQRWGVDWFQFPNPIYGEWQRMLGDNSEAHLRSTKMAKP